MPKKMNTKTSSTVVRADNQKKSVSNRMWNAGLATLSDSQLRQENTRYMAKLRILSKNAGKVNVLVKPMWTYYNHYLNQIDWLMVQRLQIPF